MPFVRSRLSYTVASVLLGWLASFVFAGAAPVEKSPNNAQIEKQYSRWKAKLSSAQQAWETWLQHNLGETNRLIYERAKVEGKATEFDYVKDDPALPHVLLIGDSISCGYTLAVREALAGKANIYRAPANCGSTTDGVQKLDAWLGNRKWDVIHFNFGIHDWSTDPAVYEKQLEQIVDRLEGTGAKLIWASTTPVPPDTAEGPAAALAIDRENHIARHIMHEHGIAIDRLHHFITPHIAEVQNPHDVHFSKAGYRLLAGQVATSIRTLLE